MRKKEQRNNIRLLLDRLAMPIEPIDSVVTLVTDKTPVGKKKKSHNQEMRKKMRDESSKENSIKSSY